MPSTCATGCKAEGAVIAKPRRRITAIRPGFESLESRRLLSFLQPFGNKFDRVRSGGVLDLITVSGPGQVFHEEGRSRRGRDRRFGDDPG